MNLTERLGFAPDDRVLILNADDVGSSHASNAAAFECVSEGSLTSASILVPSAWFPETAAYARAHPEADFGLHLTLTCEYDRYRWRALTDRSVAPGLYDEEGYLWRTAGQAIEHVSAEEAERELRAQIEAALAAGIDVTHLDTHMGTVVQPRFIDVYISLGLEYQIPLFAFWPDPEFLRSVGLGEYWSELEPRCAAWRKPASLSSITCLSTRWATRLKRRKRSLRSSSPSWSPASRTSSSTRRSPQRS